MWGCLFSSEAKCLKTVAFSLGHMYIYLLYYGSIVVNIEVIKYYVHVESVDRSANYKDLSSLTCDALTLFLVREHLSIFVEYLYNTVN